MRVEKASHLKSGRKDSQITRCSVHVDKNLFQLRRSGQINNSNLILRGSPSFDVNQIGSEPQGMSGRSPFQLLRANVRFAMSGHKRAQRTNDAECGYDPDAGGAEIALR